VFVVEYDNEAREDFEALSMLLAELEVEWACGGDRDGVVAVVVVLTEVIVSIAL